MSCNILSDYDLKMLESSFETILCMATFMLLSLPNKPTEATMESGLNLIKNATLDANSVLQKFQ